ncbi:hypothetical protein OG739_26170 [Streptomyces longwoodensis]|uniref:hypothetical protein n=1 Tax=Streptomyces longwoodensis TaxID=68231 RepID=UPI002257D054|nr:hypothetical protein [Streptomyces longwoodensis]MCX4996188.1 hypothetical protein [Streptomyces longwoodensis]
MTATGAATAAALALTDPAPDTPVIPSERLRPDIAPETVSRFADDLWDLGPLERKETSTTKTLHWQAFPEVLRSSMKRIAWAVINKPTPAVLLSRPKTTARPFISAQTLLHASKTWWDLGDWLVQRQITSLDQVDQEMLEEYADKVRELGNSFGHARNKLFAVTRMWAYAPFLLPQDRLCMPPWDDPGAAITDFLGENDEPRGENTTAVIHPATMSPLLVWSLRVITDLAPDILAAWRESRRLLANLPPKSERGLKGRAVRQRLHEYFDELRAAGKPVPTYGGYLAPSLAKAATARGATREAMSATFIGGMLGVNQRQVSRFLKDCPEVLEGQKFADGAPLEVPIEATIDGQPWTESIEFTEAKQLGLHLSTAALVVIAYLSGMRPEEVLHLEHGCASREEREDGTVRYRVNGRHFKGVTDEEGNIIPEGEMRPEPWTVIELVHRAIEIVEELDQGPLLFPRNLTTAPRADRRHGKALAPSAVVGRLKTFMKWANELALAHGRDHELIPPDPDGNVTMQRFRRTVAWFIYRRPGGRIALGIQYGHVGSSMGESYGGRSRFDMLEILDFEEGLVMAENLATASERVASGEGISGPAASRYVAATRQFQARYEGGFLTKRQHQAIRADPNLRLYEHPESLLTCNHDPFKALCDLDRGRGPGQRTPSFSRCDLACANISRTDTHIERAKAERQAITEELADGLNPIPVAQRLRQRDQKLESIISEHEATRIVPEPKTEDDR